MKYRIQFNAVFANADANGILNSMEGVKAKVFKAVEFTQVDIVRKSNKQEYLVDIGDPTVYSSIDFDAVEATHSTDDGACEVDLDISFDLQLDFFDCINYLETMKASADNTKPRFGRFFECNHDTKPLELDGSYTNMDFDVPPVTYS